VETRTGRRATNEFDDFLTETLARQVEAEEAIHNGDISPRIEMWSTKDPVTLFRAWGPNNSGWEEVSRTFHWVASRFSNCTAYSFDLVAAGVCGDLAYTVGYEDSSMSVDGGPAGPNTLRATHVYRRESGEWKIVHRHADHHPVDQSPPAETSRPASSTTP
jgi:ketosteroid isomerase-like protein